jgi:Hemerythrin HHE cation binding domain
VVDMSTTTHPVTASDAFGAVVVDLYRDIHKAIRGELFAVTLSAGRTDPSDRAAKADLARHIAEIAELLELHAEHEDGAVQPLIEAHLPTLAEQIALDHLAFESRTATLAEQGAALVDVDGDTARRQGQRLYLDLASFTSVYLAHQDIEEREVMPALHELLGAEVMLGVHQQIIGSIPPAEMARSLALMLPAMNLDDRTELLGGMQAGAPAEVFGEVWGLAGSVLHPQDTDAVARRLGL